MNYKISEMLTTSIQTYPTATSGKSSSALIDMSRYDRIIAKLLLHRLPDGKGEGAIKLGLWESSTTTWNGAVAVESSQSISSTITSASDVMLQLEINDGDITQGKRYVGYYITVPTSTVVSLVVEREGDYKP